MLQLHFIGVGHILELRVYCFATHVFLVCSSVYDATEVQKLIAKHPNQPEFHEPFASRFYNGVVGGNSTYGEEAYVLLTSLADKKKYDEQDYKQELKKFFSNPKYEKVGEFSFLLE